MIHYHGFPVTPDPVAVEVAHAGHVLISWRYPGQLSLALELAQSFIFDNGAFSAWRDKTPVTNWAPFYGWVAQYMRHPGFDWAIIPDVIDGDEKDNDALLREWPHGNVRGAPVWHMHESIDRLVRLCNDYPRVCFGSSGDYASIGDAKWWDRINLAFSAICDENGHPIAKIHGLRMLNPKVFAKLPFSSADSSNIGRNVGMDDKWKKAYAPAGPMTKPARAKIMRQRTEAFNSAQRWTDPLF